MFDKIHIFKVSLFTKFTFFKHQILGNFWIKSCFFSQCELLCSTNWEFLSNFKHCDSRAKKDLPTYIAQLEDRITDLEDKMVEKKQEMKRQLAEQLAIQRAKEEEERERARLQKLERKSKTKAGVNAAMGAVKMFKSIGIHDT